MSKKRVKKSKKKEIKQMLHIDFSISNVIDFDDYYELRMLSFCLVHNVLLHVKN